MFCTVYECRSGSRQARLRFNLIPAASRAAVKLPKERTASPTRRVVRGAPPSRTGARRMLRRLEAAKDFLVVPAPAAADGLGVESAAQRRVV